jgi:hypothetical protein
MSFNIRRVSYFYSTVRDEPGEAHHLLAQLAESGINLLALTLVPVGPMRTQLTLFPADQQLMQQVAGSAGMELDGPHEALLVRGDDRLGALADIHARLAAADVNVFASNGVTDGSGNYGYVIYVRPEQFERAVSALDL